MAVSMHESHSIPIHSGSITNITNQARAKLERGRLSHVKSLGIPQNSSSSKVGNRHWGLWSLAVWPGWNRHKAQIFQGNFSHKLWYLFKSFSISQISSYSICISWILTTCSLCKPMPRCVWQRRKQGKGCLWRHLQCELFRRRYNPIQRIKNKKSGCQTSGLKPHKGRSGRSCPCSLAAQKNLRKCQVEAKWPRGGEGTSHLTQKTKTRNVKNTSPAHRAAHLTTFKWCVAKPRNKSLSLIARRDRRVRASRIDFELQKGDTYSEVGISWYRTETASQTHFPIQGLAAFSIDLQR